LTSNSDSSPISPAHCEGESAPAKLQHELSWELDAIVRALFDASPIVAFVKDEGSKYVYVNAPCAEFIGKARSEIIGQTDETVFPEATARLNKQNDRHVLLTGDAMRSIDTGVGPDGTTREWSSLKFPFTLPSGARYVGGLVTDVTEQRRAHRTVTESQRRLKAALEAGYDAFYALEAIRGDDGHVDDFVYLDLNRNGERMLGRSRWEVVNHPMRTVHTESIRENLLAKFTRVLETRTPLEEEYPVDDSVNGTRWFRHQVVPLGDGIAVTTREVTAQKWAEATAREHTRVLENALGGIAFIADQGYFTYSNVEFCRTFGMAAEDLDGHSWGVIIASEDSEKFASALNSSPIDGRVEIECQGRRADGTPLYLRCMLIEVIGNTGSAGHYLFADDITEKRRYEAMLEEQNRQLTEARAELQAANARLQELATTDGLTGLRNRREFEDRLAQHVQAANRYGHSLSMIMMDVDRFKLYNDAYGHPAGDEVLRQVASILSDKARAFDVVGRYGGEEFAVLLPETDLEGAIVVAERYRVAFEEADWRHRSVTASFGCAQLGPETGSAEALVQAADDAMYQSKQAGRNRVTPLPG